MQPKKLTVAKAADLVGVGRPAFSAFLNGRAAVTAEMASKIEVAFQIDSQALMRMQAEFDTFNARAAGISADVRRHVVPLLAAKARDIEDWIERNIGSRARLSVFLRTLVNSTSSNLTAVDFPGNDDAERPGWDGWTECGTPNPWVPAGMSGWEFGVNTDIKTKADGDYAKSLKAVKPSDRKNITFIFVTPRHWPGKAAWMKSMADKKQWRDVRAYDSSDLEQWLEQSVPGQAWFAAERNDPSIGTRSLDQCWDEWVGPAGDRLPKQLFDVALNAAKAKLSTWANAKEANQLTIAADSTEEALALLSIAFSDAAGADLAQFRDRCVVFVEPGALSRVAGGTKDFVAIVPNRAVERELGPHAATLKSIVITPRNTAGVTADLALEPLTPDAFAKGFEEVGTLSREEVDRLARESGRSLTVLRRRVSTVRAVQVPQWAEDKDLAAALVPFLFAGAWLSQNQADQEALCGLAGTDSYAELEQRAQHAVAMADAPIWSVGAFRGVVSKIDMLFSIAGSLTAPTLERFFELAPHVLGEDDPRLDLPEKDRWAAAIHNKKRAYSESLRDGFAESVVLLAVHGKTLVDARTGFACEDAATMLVRSVLTPLTTRKLEANQGDLPAYAEAAPGEFLDILETDLRTTQPQSFGLLRNSDTMFGGCPRSGLLWALEGLAWNPKTLRRVVLILGKLATVQITDNWSNKPISSLHAIFSAWMPQTAADYETRLKSLHLLADKFPDVAWQVCTKMTDGSDQTGHYSHKPRWRNDGHGHGEPFKTWDPINKFRRAAAEILLGWKHGFTATTICDFVGALHHYDETHRERIWLIVSQWAAEASESDRALVREKVRVSLLSKRASRHASRSDWPALTAAAKTVYDSLEPKDPVFRYQWLFANQWVTESADEINSDVDYASRDERILKLRIIALKHVWRDGAAEGLRRIAVGGNAAYAVGSIAVRHVIGKAPAKDLLVNVIGGDSPDWDLVAGALGGLEPDIRNQLLMNMRADLPVDRFVKAVTVAPFTALTWALVDTLPQELKLQYWSVVRPWRVEKEELVEAAERLLAAGRPRAAFYISQYDAKTLGADLMYRVLLAIAQGGGESESDSGYRLDEHWLRKAFDVIEESTALSLEQKAGLEFAYIDALVNLFGRSRKSHLHNLELYVEKDPDFYIQALVWTYKRRDGKEDPPELVAPEARKRALAERGHKMLDGLMRLPGYGIGTELRHDLLLAWVRKVRDRARELDRLEVADLCIGRLLSTAPEGTDGVWPCEPVRQVLEDLQSKKMVQGVSMGRFNSRGVTTRGRGGDQERDLAADYRKAENALEFSYPFVATALLGDLAGQYERMAKHEDTEDLIMERLR